MQRQFSAWRRTLVLAGLMPIGWVACVHQPVLRPEPTAQQAPGKRDTALAEVDGVRVLVAGDAWKRRGSALDEHLTPVEVAIENHSGKALRIAYQDFALRGGTGTSYAPLAPSKEDGPTAARQRGTLIGEAVYSPMVVYVPVTARCSNQERLVDVPYLSYSYPGVTPSGGVFPYTDDRNDPSCAKTLPTAEMLAAALPQGPIQNNAKVAGFIYFRGLDNRESAVQFTMNLVDASNGQSLGQVSIPFAVSN